MRRFLAALAVVGLTACGGSDGGSSDDAGSDRVTVTALAEKLGCTGLEIETDSSQRELGAREEGSCQFAGEGVTILTYNENSAQDMANDIAKEFGGIAVAGDRWTVRVDTDATAERVRAKLGGKLDY